MILYGLIVGELARKKYIIVIWNLSIFYELTATNRGWLVKLARIIGQQLFFIFIKSTACCVTCAIIARIHGVFRAPSTVVTTKQPFENNLHVKIDLTIYGLELEILLVWYKSNICVVSVDELRSDFPRWNCYFTNVVATSFKVTDHLIREISPVRFDVIELGPGMVARMSFFINLSMLSNFSVS